MSKFNLLEQCHELISWQGTNLATFIYLLTEIFYKILSDIHCFKYSNERNEAWTISIKEEGDIPLTQRNDVPARQGDFVTCF